MFNPEVMALLNSQPRRRPGAPGSDEPGEASRPAGMSYGAPGEGGFITDSAPPPVAFTGVPGSDGMTKLPRPGGPGSDMPGAPNPDSFIAPGSPIDAPSAPFGGPGQAPFALDRAGMRAASPGEHRLTILNGPQETTTVYGGAPGAMTANRVEGAGSTVPIGRSATQSMLEGAQRGLENDQAAMQFLPLRGGPMQVANPGVPGGGPGGFSSDYENAVRMATALRPQGAGPDWRPDMNQIMGLLESQRQHQSQDLARSHQDLLRRQIDEKYDPRFRTNNLREMVDKQHLAAGTFGTEKHAADVNAVMREAAGAGTQFPRGGAAGGPGVAPATVAPGGQPASMRELVAQRQGQLGPEVYALLNDPNKKIPEVMTQLYRHNLANPNFMKNNWRTVTDILKARTGGKEAIDEFADRTGGMTGFGLWGQRLGNIFSGPSDEEKASNAWAHLLGKSHFGSEAPIPGSPGSEVGGYDARSPLRMAAGKSVLTGIGAGLAGGWAAPVKVMSKIPYLNTATNAVIGGLNRMAPTVGSGTIGSLYNRLTTNPFAIPMGVP
jgi:hypothetical protein